MVQQNPDHALDNEKILALLSVAFRLYSRPYLLYQLPTNPQPSFPSPYLFTFLSIRPDRHTPFFSFFPPVRARPTPPLSFSSSLLSLLLTPFHLHCSSFSFCLLFVFSLLVLPPCPSFRSHCSPYSFLLLPPFHSFLLSHFYLFLLLFFLPPFVLLLPFYSSSYFSSSIAGSSYLFFSSPTYLIVPLLPAHPYPPPASFSPSFIHPSSSPSFSSLSFYLPFSFSVLTLLPSILLAQFLLPLVLSFSH